MNIPHLIGFVTSDSLFYYDVVITAMIFVCFAAISLVSYFLSMQFLYYFSNFALFCSAVLDLLDTFPFFL